MNLAAETGIVCGYFPPVGTSFARIVPLFFGKQGKIKITKNKLE
jgi:hypothetical protein